MYFLLLLFIFIMILYCLTTISIEYKEKDVVYLKESLSFMFVKKPHTEPEKDDQKFINLTFNFNINKKG